MSALQVEYAPFCEPVSLEDQKAYLNVTSNDDDALITGLIQAAREYCEMFTRRSFINKGYVQYLDSFPYYTDSVQSQQAYPPAYYSLPRYSTTLWNYSQLIKLLVSRLASVSHITYWSTLDGRPKALTLGYLPWFPLDDAVVGQKITDSNGTAQTCTVAGKTGATEPTWATVANQTTEDGDATWKCDGVPAPDGGFIVDAASEPPRIFPRAGQYWPGVLYVPNAVAIHFTAGCNDDVAITAAINAYKDQSPVPTDAQVAAEEARLRRLDVPQQAITFIKTLVAHWYDNRWGVMADNLKEVPKSMDTLLWSLRVLDMAPTRG